MFFRILFLFTFCAFSASLSAQFNFGCTNLFACNYDPDATIDDGSCVFSLEGVIQVDDGPATSLDPFDTGIELYWELLSGGMNVVASGEEGETQGFEMACGCNAIRTTAEGDEDWEGGVFIPETAYWNIDFLAFPDVSGTMVGTNEKVTIISNTNDATFCFAGCKDPVACNYNPFATFHDLGLCTYGGCTDPSACNYNDQAACDDGSCAYVNSCIEGGCRDADGFEVGFTGAYGNDWNPQFNSFQNGSVEVSDYAIQLRSPNINFGGASEVSVSHETVGGDFVVDWSWTSVDVPEGESPYYAIDGVKTYLNTPGSLNASGTLNLSFSYGQDISFGIESDAQNGRSVLRLSNLRYEGQTCGCTFEDACNYDNTATYEDDSCCFTCFDLTVGGGSQDADISWELLNVQGQVVLTGGAGSFSYECLPIDLGCYWIRMMDAGGNGWNGATWSVTEYYGVVNSGTLASGSEGIQFFASIGGQAVNCQPEFGCNLPQACNYDPSATSLDLNLCILPECDDPMAVNYYSPGCPGPCYYQTNACGDLVNAQGHYLELTGVWAPNQWSTAYGGPQSILEGENGQALHSPSQLWLACHESLIDPNDQGPREIQRYIVAPSALTLTFDYAYIPRDLDPEFDEGYSTAFVNAGGRIPLNAFTYLPASGTLTVSVAAGDTLGFGMETLSTIYGRDLLQINNLRYDAPVCGCTASDAINFNPFAQSDSGACLFASLCEGLTDEEGAVSGLVMDYAPTNWSTSTPGNSEVVVGEHTLYLQGNTNGFTGQTASATFTAPADGDVRFEWTYANPTGTPSSDQPLLIHNGSSPLLTNSDLLNSGKVVVSLSAGDTFGFELESDGSATGASLLIERIIWENLWCTPGCTYPEAPNYDPLATTDDGSCLPSPPTCSSDVNGDGEINSQDLLIVLGGFGGSCEE